MSVRLRIIAAIIRKDLIALWPMSVLTIGLLLIQVAFDNFELGVPVGAANFTVMTWLACALYVAAVIQHDTTVSVTHDWLTRPVGRAQLLAAKAISVTLTLYVPLVLARAAVYLALGYSVREAALTALDVDATRVLLGLPIVIAAAAVTPTVLQAAAAVIGVFAVVFLVPTFLLPQLPGFGTATLDEAVLSLGSGWVIIQLLTAVAAGATTVILWLQYARRRTGLARAAFAIVPVLVVCAGATSIGWEDVLAVQRATAAEPPPAEFALEHSGACFPAESAGPTSGTADSAARSQFIGTGIWSDEALAWAGPDAVAYSTAVSASGIPEGWRLMVGHVSATYLNDEGEPLERMRPARFTAASRSTLDGRAAAVHHWLLPRAATERLASEPGVRLTLDYSLSLLEPHAAELPVDGRRYALQDLGYCSAEHDAAAAKVTVDCFKRGAQPALITAAFAGALARSDSDDPDYTPAWLEPLTGRRYKMTVAVPSGVDRSIVTLTAYEDRAHFERRIASQGVLGGPITSCPIPSIGGKPAVELTNAWRDRSAHETAFVNVGDGVRLEVLDWGGAGRPIVLLAGLGNSAHVYDELALRLAREYRVYGISRRAHGASTVAEAGYDAPRLAADIVRVLHALELDAPVMVGHSMAGEELNVLGARHAERVAGLVYLDAAADRSRERSRAEAADARVLPPPPEPLPRELVSYAALEGYFARIGSVRYPEGEILASFAFAPDGSVGGRSMDPRVPDAIIAAVHPPDYAAIRVPALAIFAIPKDPNDLMRPWYDANDPVLRQAVETAYERTVAERGAMRRAFEAGVADSRVIEIPGARHHVFMSNPEEVLAAIRSFVGELNQHSTQ